MWMEFKNLMKYTLNKHLKELGGDNFCDIFFFSKTLIKICCKNREILVHEDSCTALHVF